MKRLAAILVCFLMTFGAFGAIPVSGTVPDAASGPMLAPSPPWSPNTNSDPYHALDSSEFPKPSSPFATVTGNTKCIVILINFNDTTNSSAHTPAYFYDLILNASKSSMSKYFNDSSFATFNISGDVTTKFYTASHNESYYGMYESSSPQVNGYGNTQNLTYEAINAADADIDFSKYDSDSDGKVDHLIIVHAGKDDANDGDGTGPGGDPQVWSHAWALNSLQTQLDGKWLNKYTVLSEDDPVGIYCHEFAHDIGIPDLYDTNGPSGDVHGNVGRWDLMAQGAWNNGGVTPAMISAWCRVQMGWLTPVTINTDTTGISASRYVDNAAAWKVWVNFSNAEYFLVENRQLSGWDASLPGAGLLIWHVNDSAPDNDNGAFRLLWLEEANNNENPTEAADTWKSSVTGMTPTSSPNTNDDSGKTTGIRIYNISASGNPMIFDVSLGNNPPYAPTATVPGDNSWTNNSKPTLNWTFNDPNAGDTQNAYQAQVDDDNAFGSVNWDSGLTVTGTQGCVVGSALAEGKWYWRVRTRDQGGLWSGYNATVRSFNIDMTAPAAPTPVTATPSSWTITNSFSVDWTVPSEGTTSGIAVGCYYKLDAVPANQMDGTWSSSKPVTGITVSGTGSHTLYIWLKDGVSNINHQNRSTVTLYYDGMAPLNPAVASPTHNVSRWSNVVVASVNWSGASDPHSGIDGFSYVWDLSPSTLPDATKDAEENIVTVTSGSLADGTWYFHIRTCDNVGNWNLSATHFGPIRLDTVAPKGVDGASSTTHLPGTWNNRTAISAQWWGASDAASGVGGYSFVFDSLTGTVPDAVAEVNGSFPNGTSPALPDGGTYYVHIRVVDEAGNWNGTAFHLGPFKIDATPPDNPVTFRIISDHTIGVWSPVQYIEVSWEGFTDGTAGVDGFSFLWDGAAGTLPDPVKDIEEADNSTKSTKLASGRFWLHIRTRDNAGNWNLTALHIGPFMIDVDVPSAVPATDEENITGSPVLKWAWPPAADTHSGLAGYLVTVGTTPDGSDVVDGLLTVNVTFELDNATDGHFYYLRVRAVDNAGNVGDFGSSSDGILVDLSAPFNLTIRINGGANYTNSTSVTLGLGMKESYSGFGGMRFSMDGQNWSDWLDCNSTYAFTLPMGDGPKTVFFQARDGVGNVADPVNDTIVLDMTGPLVKRIDTENGKWLVNCTGIGLVVTAEDLHSGVAAVRLSSDGEKWTDWLAYGGVLPWNLAGMDGDKRVFVQAIDVAGNIGDPLEFKLTLDTRAPGKVTVSSTTHPRSDSWYNATTLKAGWSPPMDPSGIMGYSYIFTSGNELPGYTVNENGTQLTLTIASGGLWHLRLRALDMAGNWGDPSDFVIQVDLEGPAAPAPQAPAADASLLEGSVGINWAAGVDAQSGIRSYQMMVDDSSDFTSTVFDGVVADNGYSTPVLTPGNYFWKVRAQDKAGNWGPWGTTQTFKIAKPGGGGGGDQPSGGFFSMSNLPMLVMLFAVIIGVSIAIAAVASRKKKEPPEEEKALEHPKEEEKDIYADDYSKASDGFPEGKDPGY